jgi:hypothetical protein
VTFSDFPLPELAQPITLKVAIRPVEGEERTDNNSAEYPLIFSLE